MNSVNIFLLDDNAVFLQALEAELCQWLQTNTTLTATLYSFTDAAALMTAAAEMQVDLIIADIELGPDQDGGITVVTELQKLQPDCAVIYLTAFLEYATDIFETAPLYFILKDEYAARLPRAMARFLKQREEQQLLLSITSDGSTISVPLRQLIYCERRSRNTVLFLEDGRELPTRLTITALYAMLPAGMFSICHAGFIVNHHHISRVKRSELTLANGFTLPISRSCCDSFREQYHHWLLSRQ